MAFTSTKWWLTTVLLPRAFRAVWSNCAARSTRACPDLTGRIATASRHLFALGAALALAASPASSAHAAGAQAPNPASPHRAIAIAEDQRRAGDGEIAGYLTSKDAALRAHAARALGRIQDSTSAAVLLAIVADPDTAARHEAIFALGQIGLAHPGCALLTNARTALELTLSGKDTTAADLAVEALGKIGDRAATAQVAAMLSNPSARVRGDAAVALWRLADSTALEALIDHHDDPDPEVKWRVIWALEKQIAPDRVVLKMAQHLDDPEWLVRAYALRTIGRQKSTRGAAYVLQKLDDPEPAVVVNALRALQSIADSSGTLALRRIAAALSHPHPYVRQSAATALGDRFAWGRADSVSRQAARETLLVHLRDLDAATRGACARALAAHGWLGQGNARGMLHDTSVTTCVLTLQALPLIGARDGMPLALPRLKRDVPLPERMAAAEALGAMHAKGAIPELRAALSDSSTLFVAAAAGALGDLADSASVPLLAAAYALRATDADADARIGIHDALAALAGKSFADSIERAHPVSNAQPPNYATDFEQTPKERGAVLHTTAGDIEWAFETNEAPQTVRNFVRLADRGYFNGTTVHRVVPNFVVQDGDPTGTGSGGPGYTIRCEYNRLRYLPGMVGMALSGKDTGGSQWFITHSPQLHLDGKYTIFAHVTRGMDVVHAMVQGDRVLKVEILR